MGWLRDRLGMTTKEERDGVHLDSSAPHREIRGPKDFPRLLRALGGWLPDGAVLYFEGGYPDAEIEAFMAAHAVPEPVHIALGTIWPRPRVFHVPATSATLGRLAEIMERHAGVQLAVHFHIHRDGAVLLEWYDAFLQDMMMVAGSISDEAVAVLVERFRSAGR